MRTASERDGRAKRLRNPPGMPQLTVLGHSCAYRRNRIEPVSPEWLHKATAFSAKGRKAGFSSGYQPAEIACRVDQASKVAAACCAILSASHPQTKMLSFARIQRRIQKQKLKPGLPILRGSGFTHPHHATARSIRGAFTWV